MRPVKEINLDIVFYREDDMFVAHCLQLDIVAQAHTISQAECDIEDLIIAHTMYTIENDDWDNYFKPAPPMYWALLPKASPEESKSVQSDIPDMDMGMIYSMRKWLSEGVSCE